MNDPHRKLVEKGYGRAAGRYLATRDLDDPLALSALEGMTRELPPGAPVLDLGCGAGIVPTRVSNADTEPVSVGGRTAWFRAHDPSRRPIRVTEDEDGIVGWLSLGDFYDGRPACHATAEVGVYVSRERRGAGVGRRLAEEAASGAPGLGVKTPTAGIFAHNETSVALFKGFGFEAWARFPKVAVLGGVE